MATIALLAGGFTWTLLEYLLHRFVFHERRLGVALSREHLEHHAKVDWFAPMVRKLLLAAVVLPTLTALAVPLVGWGSGCAYVSGVVGGWLAYEALHRAIHVWAPRSAYGRYIWRHHLYHHFGDPRRNHGVSSPVWDVVFFTHMRVTTVTVPARAARKLPWLLDGDVIPAHLAGTYVLRA
jgi:sterol desaturase/sphingolipid hydroxylase (fatty acid hydroxylase superfamily)